MQPKKEIIFPDNTKLYITYDESPQIQEITPKTIEAVKAVIAEFPNAKTISSIDEVS